MKTNTSYRVEIGFGIGNDRNGFPIKARTLQHNKTAIETRAVHEFGGYTWINTSGGWMNPKGVCVKEQGMTLLLLGSGDVFVKRARDFAVDLRDDLKQECVCFTVSECHT